MATYQLISSVTVGSGGAANIEFTSIPATYTDLLVKISARTTRSDIANAINLSLNGSTANFTYKLLEGDGASAYSANGSTSLIAVATGSTATSNTFSNAEFYIPNYASSNNKSISADSVLETNATTTYADLIASLWSNSAAITSITLTPASAFNFVQYSTAYLYGISNA